MKIFKVYGCCLGKRYGNALAFSLEPWPPPNATSIDGGRECEFDTSFEWDIVAPDSATPEESSNGMLCLAVRLGDADTLLTPNDVFALADLRLHGFRLVEQQARQ